MIRRSAELHLEHIATSGDPFEFGSAKPLDYGHWAAHKLECLTGYEIRHGEAVAVGMAIDARYACDAGMLAERDVARICALLERLGFCLWHPALEWRDDAGRCACSRASPSFASTSEASSSSPCSKSVGRSRDVNHIDETLVARAIDWLQMRARSAA
jgi:3-dehydroquinate synthase